MAPAASTLSATSAASKRPLASDAEELPVIQQSDDETAHKGHQPRQQQLECPRCQSTNTKFCYYNNYSTAQPRHFCRACRRYWTHGGTLRDVPVGGASRRAGGGGKRRRLSAEPSTSPSSASASSPPQVNTCLLAPPDLSPAAFPFLSDGSFLMPPHQLDLIGAAPAAFSSSSWQSALVPDFYDGFPPWDDGAAGAWGDIAGLEFIWPPPGN